VRARAAVACERTEEREPADLWALLSPPAPLWKRAFDIALATLLLLAMLPLFALVALAIRLESEGPVFFRQQRVGRGGRLFTFYKFRSMYADAEARRDELADRNEQEGPIFKMRRDPRVTRIGRWLRRTSVDEMPQLWNVLKGDFSLVGPRPPTPDEVLSYEPWQRRRLSIPGGLTCLWQVSGRSEVGFEDWMRLDMRYVARRGLWQDLVLLARTVPAVLSGRGAY
jgi:lipopolysaccharide/colanic/teichoic acid biosynthesis glycosyltransferase